MQWIEDYWIPALLLVACVWTHHLDRKRRLKREADFNDNK